MPHAIYRLTDHAVRQVAAAKSPRKLSDGAGLHLLILPTATISPLEQTVRNSPTRNWQALLPLGRSLAPLSELGLERLGRESRYHGHPGVCFGGIDAVVWLSAGVIAVGSRPGAGEPARPAVA